MVCLSHLILGAVPQFGAALVETTGRFAYGATVDLTPQLHHVLRMLGAFMIGIGVMAAFAWKDPLTNRQIIIGIGIILILRASQRVLFGSAIQDAFQLSLQQLMLQGMFFFMLGVALIWLAPRPAAARS
jgi:uncharacterized protein YjeT (DUF2065 family)